MNNPIDLFTNIIDQAFPGLDEPTKEIFKTKMRGYILLRLEEECYKNDQDGSRDLHVQMGSFNDQEKSTFYGERIGEKFVSLPETERALIIKKLDIEFKEVMNKIYREAN